MSFGGQTTRTTQTRTLDPRAQVARGDVAGALTPFLGTSPQQAAFQGQRVSDFTAPTLEAQQQALDLARSGIGGLVPATTEGFTGLLGQLTQQGVSPELQAALDAIQQQNIGVLQRDILPQLGRSALLSGGFGGSRQGIAQGVATGDVLSATAGQQSLLAFQDIARRQQQTQSLLGLAPSIGQFATQPIGLLQNVGLQQQALAQANIDAELQRFAEERDIPFQRALGAGGLLGSLDFGETIESVQKTSGAGLGQVLGGLGLAGLGLAIPGGTVGGQLLSNLFGLNSVAGATGGSP